MPIAYQRLSPPAPRANSGEETNDLPEECILRAKTVQSTRGSQQMQISRVLRTAFLLVLSLSLASVLGYANEPAEDIFHKGVQVFQSGDKIAAVKLFITSANAGNTKAAAQVGWCYEFGV